MHNYNIYLPPFFSKTFPLFLSWNFCSKVYLLYRRPWTHTHNLHNDNISIFRKNDFGDFIYVSLNETINSLST